MAFRKDRVTFTTSAATGSALLIPRSDFIEIIGFRCLSTGDTATRVTLTDFDGRVAYADGADVNYTTQKDTLIGTDVTLPTSGWTLKDSTGAAGTIALGNGVPARGPVTVAWSNGTSGDSITFDLYYKFPLTKKTVVLTSTGSTVSATTQLPSLYNQVIGFSAVTPGGDNATRIQLQDADSRTFFLDAGDKDYSSRVNVTIGYDDTLTGLTPTHLDAAGNAATATSAAPLPVVKAPITVSWINAGNNGDVLTVDLYARI